MPTQQLTEPEIQAMRTILAQHDSQHQPMTTLDLNNPPRVQYRFQKFPMTVYNHEQSYPSHDVEQPKQNSLGFETVHVPARVVNAIVNSDEELQQFIDSGWSDQAPAFTEEREEHLSAKYENEAARFQEQIEERRKVGRPRKVA